MAVIIEGTQSKEQVICADCVHAVRGLTIQERIASWIFDPTAKFVKCAHSAKVTTEYDPVTGKTTTDTKLSYCSTERKFVSNGECGPDGVFWTPRKKEDLFKLMKRI